MEYYTIRLNRIFKSDGVDVHKEDFFKSTGNYFETYLDAMVNIIARGTYIFNAMEIEVEKKFEHNTSRTIKRAKASKYILTKN